MKSSFDWKPKRTEGIWRYGAPWLRPLFMAAPWLTVLILLEMFYRIGGTLISERGALVDLPASELEESDVTGPVALIMPSQHGTLVFLDDSRYVLGESASESSLADQLDNSFQKSANKTILALSDRNVPAGDLLKFSTIARDKGFRRILFAQKKPEAEE